MIDTALALLKNGFWPVPIKPNSKAPIGESWGVTKPTEESLRATYAAHPGAGVGLLLGPEGGFVDIECDGPEGEASYTKLMGGEVPETGGWSSARGPHHVFNYDVRLARYGKSVIKLPELPGLELRIGEEGKQLQSICPPTVGSDGKPRKWNGAKVIAALPECVFEFLDNALTKPAAGNDAPRPSGFQSTATDGASPEVRARAYVFAPSFPDSIEGQGGHDRLYHVASVLVDGFGLARGEALPILRDWNAQKARPPEGERQINHKLDDAIKKHPIPSRKLLNAPRPGSGGTKATAPEGKSWGPLRLKNDLPPAADFPLDVLPLPARRLAEAAAKSIGCPVDFVALPMLAVAGGTIGRSVHLLLKRGYFASATIYGACVGPPSDGKTPALKVAATPIRAIDDILAAEHAQAMARWRQDVAAAGTGKGTKPPAPKPRRIDIDDATMEVIPILLADNPRGLVKVNDELTSFVLGMNQYKSGGKGSDRSNALKIWSGDRITRDRVAHESNIPIRSPFPSLSIVGGIVPDMLGEMVDSQGRADGFIDRFLVVYPESMPMAGWSELGIPTEYVDDWKAIIVRLWERPLNVVDGRSVPHVALFSDDGKARWIERYNAHIAEMNGGDFDPTLRGAWGKFREYAGRLALNVGLMHHAADPTGDPFSVPLIGPKAVEGAWELIAYFKSHALRVHTAIGYGAVTGKSRAFKAILEWIQNRGVASFTEHEIKRARSWIDDENMADALKSLADKNVIRACAPPPSSPKGGRPPSSAYEVNPALGDCQPEGGFSGSDGLSMGLEGEGGGGDLPHTPCQNGQNGQNPCPAEREMFEL